MKHTAVPLAPRLEECLVTLDARRMVDLGATPGGRNGDDEQAGSISNPSIPRQKRERKSSAQLRRQHVRGSGQRVSETPTPSTRCSSQQRGRRERGTGHPPPIADDEVAPVETDEADDLLLVLPPPSRPGRYHRARAIFPLGRHPPSASARAATSAGAGEGRLRP